MPNQKIAIIGFGALGKALAGVLESKSDEVLVCGWDIIQTGDPRQVNDVQEALKNAAIIMIAVPSAYFIESVQNLKNNIPVSSILITCTKGVDKNSQKLPIEILEKQFPKNTSAVLSGPMLAEELVKNLPTKATIASKQIKKLESVQKLFVNTNLSFEFSSDTIGVSLCGILKNIYTLALGLSDGLKLGANFKACLALQAIKEMQSIIKEQGGKTETIFTNAGLADFLATGYSLSSRNYASGFKKAKGEISNIGLVEGVENINNIISRLKNPLKMPLIFMLKSIFLENTALSCEILRTLVNSN